MTSDTNGPGVHGDGGLDLRTAVAGLAAPEVERRILTKAQYDMESGCWIWTGWTNQAATPYGRLSINNVKVYAHRASYEVFVGPIPDGHEIDHLCQTSLCVNPDHLEAVSPEENRDRVTQRRTHCKRGHEFTEENTYWVREGARACRACRARQDLIQKQRKRGVPEDEIVLLPTPACNDMGAAYTPETWDEWTAEMKAKHNNGNGHGKSLNVEAQRLLPTPTRRDHKDTEVRREPHRPDDVDTLARALTDVLLPTPTAKDAAQSGGSSPSDITRTDAVIRTDLGRQENPRHAHAEEDGPREELRGVRDASCTQTVCERSPGGPERLPQAEALLPELREQSPGRAGEHAPLASPAGQAPSCVRGVRDDGCRTACASQRPGCDEQRAGEPDGPLCVVSPAPALAGGSGRPDGLDFGPYSAAIERWEAVLGRQAPAPTKLNSKGNAKLSDEFDEFLMGLPAGWITDVPGITWNETLKACGNGVVWQQGAAALRWLLGVAA